MKASQQSVKIKVSLPENPKCIIQHWQKRLKHCRNYSRITPQNLIGSKNYSKTLDLESDHGDTAKTL